MWVENFLVTPLGWLLTALSVSLDYKTWLFYPHPHSPPPPKKTLIVARSWWQLHLFSHSSLQPPSEEGEHPTFHLYLCDGIFRSHPVSSSSDPLMRLSLGWGNCTTGECYCHYDFLFPTFTLVQWPKYRFSTLFYVSFCSGSKWGGPCPAGLTSVLTVLTEDTPLPIPQPVYPGRLRWES